MDGSFDLKLIDACRPWLLSVANACIPARFRGRLEPADIVENTLTHAMMAVTRGSCPSNLRGWLLVLLGQKIVDGKRHATRYKRDVTRELSTDFTREGNQELEDWLLSDISSPSKCAMRNEHIETLMSAISRLPKSQREAITLKFVHGLSVAEIVKQMSSTEGSVAGYLRRGMQGIAKMIGPREGSNGEPSK